MVLYDYDSNIILTDLLKNNMTTELVRAQMRLTQYILDCGLNPMALRIKNECPEALKLFFRANSIEFQLGMRYELKIGRASCAPPSPYTNL